ncbi:MAG: hypothetical protein SNH73_05495 [Rikenellaceae bacterium]
MKSLQRIVLSLLAVSISSMACAQSEDRGLSPLVDLPEIVSCGGEATVGKMVAIMEPEYQGTKVHHMVYLPTNYDKSKKMPLIVEYTGNRWNYGNGTVEEALLGYSLTLGRDFIWVVLPYIALDGEQNQDLWWGDADATAEYARVVIPRIVEEYNADADNIILCGFSRGSIGVSYIGLHDDATAQLWSAFLSHDHFDGQQEWGGKSWGSPLEKYRTEAAERLKRVAGRSWLVCSQKPSSNYKDVIDQMGASDYGVYSYLQIPTSERFEEIPNEYFAHPHTDRWALFDIPESDIVRKWLYDVSANIQK